ncbi:hypothetical protein [Mariniluteicoccus flavus]
MHELSDRSGLNRGQVSRTRTPQAAPAAQPPLFRVAALPAVAMAVLLLATSTRYDLHGDELYFRMLPVAWWYEDQPPLTVWLSRLAAAVSDAAWVQRLPAIIAAAAGVVLAAYAPRLLGHGVGVQRVAAWAHAGTVYPLIVGHVFLTSSIDLVVWQGVIVLVLAALRGRPVALAWAGVLVGLGCWNKLLVLFLAAALVAGLLVADRRLLRTRWAALGLASLVVLGGAQVVAQLAHGLPMSQVSGDLIALNGGTNRWLVLPLLVAFVGPPFLGVWWRGLGWRPTGARTPPVLAVAVALITGWTLLFPAQPYYPVAAVLPALAIGWGAAREADAWAWRHRRVVVAANSAVALVLSLPLLPTSSAVYRAVSAVNPVQRDQAGWRGYVQQLAAARGSADTAVVTDAYALAGAASHYGPAYGIDPRLVASGHNALWNLGPPATDAVLLVGARAVEHRARFTECTAAGALEVTRSDPFGVAGSPMLRCRGPIGGWAQVWPGFRHLGA